MHKVGLREYMFKQSYLKKPEKKDKKYPEAEDFMRILYKPDLQTLWGFHNMLIPRSNLEQFKDELSTPSSQLID